MDIQNHYYGHSAALARHAGLDSVRHIDGLLQHGWTVRSPVTVHFADFPRLPRGARRLVWSHASRAQDAGSGASPLVFLRHPPATSRDDRPGCPHMMHCSLPL